MSTAIRIGTRVEAEIPGGVHVVGRVAEEPWQGGAEEVDEDGHGAEPWLTSVEGQPNGERWLVRLDEITKVHALDCDLDEDCTCGAGA
jgi:hypothetical protein